MQRVALCLIAAGALTAGCGSGADARATEAPASERRAGAASSGHAEAAPAASPAAQRAARRRRGPLVKLRGSQVGRVLFSGSDRALYLFTRDRENRTRCYGACAEAWPPFYAKGRPRAARGVDRSLLGTIRRRDGRRQVTYRDQPLYFYVDDPRGEVLCNDVVEFGGTWFAIDARGNPPG